ncbi:hypothetical protein BKA70DRAFT_1223417 [Coprinopsis sp. MPI-PUGE-AT-0042]|nr:hypothetical protein BKA70DRAFT_1223417 [Coprinopsis sp. MPI-PUGE-AT-0042]
MSSTLEDQPYRNSLNPIPDSDEEGTGEKANSAAPLAMRLSAPAFTPSLSTSIIPSATGRRRARSPASDSNSFNSALHPKRVAVQHDEALLGNLLKRLSAMGDSIEDSIASQDSKIAAQDERIATQDEKIISRRNSWKSTARSLKKPKESLKRLEKAQIFNEDLIKPGSRAQIREVLVQQQREEAADWLKKPRFPAKESLGFITATLGGMDLEGMRGHKGVGEMIGVEVWRSTGQNEVRLGRPLMLRTTWKIWTWMRVEGALRGVDGGERIDIDSDFSFPSPPRTPPHPVLCAPTNGQAYCIPLLPNITIQQRKVTRFEAGETRRRANFKPHATFMDKPQRVDGNRVLGCCLLSILSAHGFDVGKKELIQAVFQERLDRLRALIRKNPLSDGEADAVYLARAKRGRPEVNSSARVHARRATVFQRRCKVASAARDDPEEAAAWEKAYAVLQQTNAAGGQKAGNPGLKRVRERLPKASTAQSKARSSRLKFEVTHGWCLANAADVAVPMLEDRLPIGKQEAKFPVSHISPESFQEIWAEGYKTKKGESRRELETQ